MLSEQKKCAMFIADVPQNPNKRAELYKYCKNEENEDLYKFASERKIIPFVSRTLISLKYNIEFWSNCLDEYRDRNNKILHFVDLAYERLQIYDANKIFVSENFGALLTSNGDIGLFSSGDVDNFSAIEEKDKVYSAMKSLGCRIKEKYMVNRLIAAEFFPPEDFNLPDGFYFRVDFYPLERLKLPCFIQAENFIDWNKCQYYKDTHIRLADPTELMYICLIHASIHSFVRTPDYRLYIDIFNLNKCKIDYNLIRKWSHHEKTQVRAVVASLICDGIFGTCISSFKKDLSRRESKLINYVYDKNNNVLLETQNKFKILKIDIMCNDKSNIAGIYDILFPNKNWMKTTYGNSNLKAYLKHFMRLF